MISDTSFINALNIGALQAKATDAYHMNNIRNTYAIINYTATPFCSSGNCTFEPYVSLGIQHQCLNISDTIQYQYAGNTVLNATMGNTTTYLHQIMTNATLPISPILNSNSSLHQLRISYLNVSYDGGYHMSSDSSLIMVSPIANVNWKLGLGGVAEAMPLAEVFMILSLVEHDFQSPPPSMITQAFHCRLDFGMQVFTGSVRNGKFVETPLEFFRGNWTQEPYPSQADPGWGYWVLRQNVNGKGHEITLDTVFSTILQTDISFYFTVDQVTTSDISQAIFFAGMYRDSSIGVDATFGLIADSLTTYFRMVSGQYAVGTAETSEQYIRVQWEWLLVPLALVTLNTIFVLLVRLQSRRLGLPSWRNSALALLYGEADRESGGVSGGMQHDDLLIGPPASMGRPSKLGAWAETRSARLRGCGEGRVKPLFTAGNDSLECLG